MTLTDVIDAYVLLQQSLGKRFKSARTLLRQFSREMGNPRIDEVEAADVATFLRGSGPLSATWTLKYRVLSGFYRFAITEVMSVVLHCPRANPSCRRNNRPTFTPPTSFEGCSMPQRLCVLRTAV